MRADSKESLTFVIWLRTIPEHTISHYAIPRSSIGNLSTHRVRERTGADCSAIAESAETVNGRAREKRPQRRKRRKRAGGRLTHRRSGTRERSQSSRRLNNRLALEWPPVKFSTPRIYPRSDRRVSLQRQRARRIRLETGPRSSEKDRDSRAVRVRECDCRTRARTSLANNEHEYITGSSYRPSGRNREWRIYESRQRSTRESIICVRESRVASRRSSAPPRSLSLSLWYRLRDDAISPFAGL